jgi:hypothetical protein
MVNLKEIINPDSSYILDPDFKKDDDSYYNRILNYNYLGIGIYERKKTSFQPPNEDLENLFNIENEFFIIDQDLNRIEFFISQVEKINFLDKIQIQHEENNNGQFKEEDGFQDKEIEQINEEENDEKSKIKRK